MLFESTVPAVAVPGNAIPPPLNVPDPGGNAPPSAPLEMFLLVPMLVPAMVQLL